MINLTLEPGYNEGYEDGYNDAANHEFHTPDTFAYLGQAYVEGYKSGQDYFNNKQH